MNERQQDRAPRAPQSSCAVTRPRDNRPASVLSGNNSSAHQSLLRSRKNSLAVCFSSHCKSFQVLKITPKKSKKNWFSSTVLVSFLIATSESFRSSCDGTLRGFFSSGRFLLFDCVFTKCVYWVLTPDLKRLVHFSLIGHIWMETC